MLGLFGEMFSNVGGKLKIIALISFFVTWVGGVIGGLLIIINGSTQMAVLGVLVILLSVLPAYLLNLPLYAFGQLVQNSDDVNYRVYEMNEKAKK
ncbi:MAG: hypothetical protein J6K62_00840 [Clostridia bacterium]|nr:hypothetical protein [Clostridia bacterium]